MQSSSNNIRRTLFTTDAKLAIKRPAAGDRFAADAAGANANQPVTLEGYAMIWNTLSDDRGGYRVRLLPGSAKFVDSVHALFHHDYRSILGATENGTLRIMPDDIGVKVEIDLPATQCAKDVATLVEDKYVRGMSFSMLYDPAPEAATKNEGGIEIQEVSSFHCDEVTVTAIPSFDTTTIGVQDGSDDDDQPAAPQESPAGFATERVAQSLQLERLRLAMTEI